MGNTHFHIRMYTLIIGVENLKKQTEGRVEQKERVEKLREQTNSQEWRQMVFPQIQLQTEEELKQLAQQNQEELEILRTQIHPQKKEEEDPRQLANDHWDFVKKVIDLHDSGLHGTSLAMAEFYYKEAFVHGWKHGRESCTNY